MAFRRMMRKGRFWVALFAGVLPGLLAAHPANLTSALTTVGRDGRVTVSLTFDVLAFALNDTPQRVPDSAMRALLDGPESELDRRMALAVTHLKRHFRILADGRDVPLDRVLFPTSADVRQWKAAGKVPLLPVLLTCEVEAHVPANLRTIAVQFPEVIGTVITTTQRPGEEPFTEPVVPPQASTALPVRLVPGEASATMAKAPESPPASPTADTATEQARTPWSMSAQSFLTTMGSFVRMGFTHILPRGLDHVLFVLGLFLLGGRLSWLLWQITAFTIAHSVTLGLALYGVIRVPSPVIEPLIAFSIVLVAVDNIRGAELHWWRVAVVFGFGLVHGMGFAGALHELGLPRGQYLRALVGFNLGVELGQLAVVGLAFAAVGWFRAWPRFRAYVAIPASIGIGGIALVWTIQRL